MTPGPQIQRPKSSLLSHVSLLIGARGRRAKYFLPGKPFRPLPSEGWLQPPGVPPAPHRARQRAVFCPSPGARKAADEEITSLSGLRSRTGARFPACADTSGAAGGPSARAPKADPSSPPGKEREGLARRRQRSKPFEAVLDTEMGYRDGKQWQISTWQKIPEASTSKARSCPSGTALGSFGPCPDVGDPRASTEGEKRLRSDRD